MQMNDLKTRLSNFKYELHHGVFYPKGYVSAFFINEDQTDQARTALLSRVGLRRTLSQLPVQRSCS